jgi:hypothetical protein
MHAPWFVGERFEKGNVELTLLSARHRQSMTRLPSYQGSGGRESGKIKNGSRKGCRFLKGWRG